MKSSQGKQWRSLAVTWQELADWRAEALKRVWLITNTIEDDVLAETLRMAMVGDFIMPIADHEFDYEPDETYDEDEVEPDA